MRYLRGSGKGSWRMYMTYAYEVTKALAITLLVEFDVKGFLRVLHGVVDGVRGKESDRVGGKFHHFFVLHFAFPLFYVIL